MVDYFQQIKEERERERGLDGGGNNRAVGTVYGIESFGNATKEFINTADNRTLRGTLYSVPDERETIDQFTGLSRAKSLVFNQGGHYSGYYDRDILREDLRTGKVSKNKYKRIIEESQQLENQGVGIHYYGNPVSPDNLHTKLWEAEHNGKKSVLVSTANISTSALEPPKKGREHHKLFDLSFNLLPFTGPAEVPGGGADRYKQINLAAKYTDENIVNQLSSFITELEQGVDPNNRENVKSGQASTNHIINLLNQTTRGDSITVASAFIDDPRVIASMADASHRGASVELLHNKSGGLQSRRDKLISRLKASGVKVLNTGNDTLLHAKAVAIKTKDGKYYSALGSSNLTEASVGSDNAGRFTRDVMVFSQGRTSEEIYKTVHSKYLDKKTKLYYTSGSHSERFKQIEIDMLDKGLSHYRMGRRYSSNLNSLPYHPTKLTPEFFASYKDTEIPDLTPYGDLYRARLGKEPNWMVRQLDNSIMTPAIGGRVNRLFGTEVYHDSEGIIGSTARSTGRFLDWVVGYDYTKERESKDEREGTIGKFLKFQDSKDDEGMGVFESVIGSTTELFRNLSASVGAYVFINLPLSHLRAQAVSEPIKALLKEDPTVDTNTDVNDVRFQAKRRIKRFVRNITFGSFHGRLLSEAIETTEDARIRGESPTSVPSEYGRRLSEASFSEGDNLLYTVFEDGDPTRPKSRIEWMNWARGGGWVNTMISATRRFEKARFDQVLKPIFEAINPYEYGNANWTEWNEALNTISNEIGRGPSIKFRRGGDNYEPTLKLEHMGSDRINEIYRSFDKLGSLLPINPIYWIPGIRRAMQLPEFDPSTQLTWSRVWPLERTSKFAEATWKVMFNVGNEFGKLYRSAKKVWAYNTIAERTLQDIGNPAVSDFSDRVSDVGDSPTTTTRQVYDSATGAYEEAIDEINSFQNDPNYRRYARAVQKMDEANRHVQSLISGRTVGQEEYAGDPARGADIRTNTETFKKALRTQRALVAVGGLLFADTIIDTLFMQGGSSILSQLVGAVGLGSMPGGSFNPLNWGNGIDESKEGEVARFQFTGSVPLAIGATAMAIGYGGGGYLLPYVEDVGHNVITTPSTDPINTKATEQFLEIVNGTATGRVSSVSEATKAKYQQQRSLYHQKLKETVRIKRARFSHSRALTTSLILGLSTKIVASGIAGVSNLLFNTGNPFEALGRGIGSFFGISPYEQGVELENDASTLLAMTLEDDLVNALETANTRTKVAESVIAKTILQENMIEEQESGNVLSLARQLPVPFFQISSLGRTKSDGSGMELGVGVQFTPTSGLGITPILPLSIRFTPREPSAIEEKLRQMITGERESDISLWDTTQVFAMHAIELLTMTSGSAYYPQLQGEDNSGFLNALDFIGFVGFSSGLSNAVSESQAYGAVRNKIRENETLQRELRAIQENLGPLYNGITNIYGTASRVTANLLTLPYKLVRGLPEATERFLRAENITDSQSNRTRDTTTTTTTGEGVETETGRTVGDFLQEASSNRLVQRGAFIWAAAVAVSALAQPTSAKTGFEDPRERLEAVIGTTALISTSIISSGALSSQQELADKFFREAPEHVIREQITRLMPKQSRFTPESWREVERAIEEGVRLGDRANAQAGGQGIYNPIRRLLADIASDEIVRRSWAATYGEEAAEAKFSQGYGKNARSVAGRFALAATAIFATKASAHLALSLDKKVLNIPILGQTVSMLTGYKDEYKLFDEYRKEEDSPISRALGWLSRTATLNYFDVADTLGMYTDKADPYLALFGPFGVSFKDSGKKLYAQLQGDVTDFSVSNYTLLSHGLNEYKRLKEVLLNTGNVSKTIDTILAYQYRTSSVQFSPLAESALNAAGKLTMRAIAIQQMQLKNLGFKHSVENYLTLMQDEVYSGRVGDPSIESGKLGRIWSTLDTFNISHNLNFIDEPIDSYTTRRLYKSNLAGYQISNKERSVFDLLGLMAGKRGDDNLPEWISKSISFGATIISGFASLISLASVGVSATTFTNYFINKKRTEDLVTLGQESKLFSGRGVAQSARYDFVEVQTDAGPRIVQFDAQQNTTLGVLLNHSSNDLSYVIPSTGQRVSGEAAVSTAYGDWISTVNEYFTRNLTHTINRSVTNAMEADGTIDWSQVKQDLKNSRNVIRSGLDIRLSGGGDLTVFDVFFRQNKGQDYTTDRFLEEIFGDEGLTDQLVNQIQDIWDSQNLAATGDAVEARVRLFNTLEHTSIFRALIDKLVVPSTARYETGVEANEEARFRRSHEEYEEIRRQQQRSDVDVRPGKLRSQTLIEEAFRGGKGATTLVGEWVGQGVSITEIVEGFGVALDDDNSYYFRKKGAEQALLSGLYHTIGVAVALGITATGAGGAVALASGIALEVGIGQTVAKVDALSKAQSHLIDQAAQWVVTPVSKIEETFGGFAAGVSELIAKPTGFLLSNLAGAFTELWEQTAAPYLVDQWESYATDGRHWQLIKSFILPRTAYYDRHLDPFKEKALRRFKRALHPDRSLSTDTIHSLPLGAASTQSTYFTGSSRLLNKTFGSHQFRVSSLMRLALERQQGLYDQRVIGSAANRFGREKKGIGLYRALAIGSLAYNLTRGVANREQIRLLLTGDISNRARAAARGELSSLQTLLGIEDDSNLLIELTDNRRSISGHYTQRGNKSIVSISRYTESMLGRGPVRGLANLPFLRRIIPGLNERRLDYLQSRFTTVHELTHHLQVSRQDLSNVVSEDQFRNYARSIGMEDAEIDRVIRTSKQMAVESARRTGIEAGTDLYQDILNKEYEANLTGFRHSSVADSTTAARADILDLESRVRMDDIDVDNIDFQRVNSPSDLSGHTLYSSTSSTRSPKVTGWIDDFPNKVNFHRYANLGTAFDLLDKFVTVLDIQYGQLAKQKTSELNRESSDAQLQEAAEDRIAAKTSTIGGVGAAFLTGNPLVALAVGAFTILQATGLRVIYGKNQLTDQELAEDPLFQSIGKVTGVFSHIIAGGLNLFGINAKGEDINKAILFGDWSGISSTLAERDRQRLLEGRAVYDSFQSVSAYVRLHRLHSISSKTTQGFIAGVFDYISTGTKQLAQYTWSQFKRFAPIGKKVIDVASKIGGSALTGSKKLITKLADSISLGYSLLTELFETSKPYLNKLSQYLYSGLNYTSARISHAVRFSSFILGEAYKSVKPWVAKTKDVVSTVFEQSTRFASTVFEKSKKVIDPAKRILGEFLEYGKEGLKIVGRGLGIATKLTIGMSLVLGYATVKSVVAGVSGLSNIAGILKGYGEEIYQSSSKEVKKGIEYISTQGKTVGEFLTEKTIKLASSLVDRTKDIGRAGLALGRSGLDTILKGVSLFKSYGAKTGQFVARAFVKTSKYGKAALEIVSKFAGAGLSILTEYGRQLKQYGGNVVQLIADYGKKGLDIVSKYGKKGLDIVSKYGKKSLDIIARYGKRGLDTISNYGKKGLDTISKYGKKGLNLLSRLGGKGLELVAQYGTKTFNLVKGVGSKVLPFTKRLGQYSVKALGVVSNLVREGISLTSKSIEYGLRAIKTHGSKVIQVIKEFGPKGLELVKKYGSKGLEIAKVVGKVSLIGGALVGYGAYKATKATVKGIKNIGKAVKQYAPYLKEGLKNIGKTVKQYAPYLKEGLKNIGRVAEQFAPYLKEGLKKVGKSSGKLVQKSLTGIGKVIRNTGNVLLEGGKKVWDVTKTPISRIKSYVSEKGGKFGKYLSGAAPQLFSRYLAKGVWETGLDVVAPLIDVYTMFSGASKLLNLNGESSSADYEKAYVEFIKAKNALVGSIVGSVLGNDIGDTVLSVMGQGMTGADWEQVQLWQESNTSGLTLLTRELRYMPSQAYAGIKAAEAGKKILNKTVGKGIKTIGVQKALSDLSKSGYTDTKSLRYLESVTGERLVGADVPMVKSKLAAQQTKTTGRLGKVLRNTVGRAHVSFLNAKREVAEQAALRYQKIFGKSIKGLKVNATDEVITGATDVLKYSDETLDAGSGFLRKLFSSGVEGAGRAAGKAARFGRHAIPIIGTLIDVGFFISGVSKAVTAKNDAEKLEGISRASGAVFSIAGDLIGTAIPIPGLGAGLSIAGEQFGRKVVGNKLGKAAIENDVDAGTVLGGASAGAGLGAVAGAVGLVALTVLTGGTGLLALGAAAAIGAGIGMASGWVAGGWATIGASKGINNIKELYKGVKGKLGHFASKGKETLQKVGEQITTGFGVFERNKTEQKQKNIFQRKLTTLKSWLLGDEKGQQTEKEIKQKEKETKELKKEGWWSKTWGFIRGLASGVVDFFFGSAAHAAGVGLSSGTGNVYNPSSYRQSQQSQQTHISPVEVDYKFEGKPVAFKFKGQSYNINEEQANAYKSASKDMKLRTEDFYALMLRKNEGEHRIGSYSITEEERQSLGVKQEELKNLTPEDEANLFKDLLSQKGYKPGDGIASAYKKMTGEEYWVSSKQDSGTTKNTKDNNVQTAKAQDIINNDAMIRIVLAESLGEGQVGMTAVARSILNRKALIDSGKVSASRYYAKSGKIEDVIKAERGGSYQYSPLGDGNFYKNWTEDQRRQAKLAIARAFDTEKTKEILKQQGLSNKEIERVITAPDFRHKKILGSAHLDSQILKNHGFSKSKLVVNMDIEGAWNDVFGGAKIGTASERENKLDEYRNAARISLGEFSRVAKADFDFSTSSTAGANEPPQGVSKEMYRKRMNAKNWFATGGSYKFIRKLTGNQSYSSGKYVNLPGTDITVTSGFGHRYLGSSPIHPAVDLTRSGSNDLKQTNPFQKARVNYVGGQSSSGLIELEEINPHTGKPTGRGVRFFHTTTPKVKAGQVIEYGTVVGQEGGMGKRGPNSYGSHSDVRYFLKGDTSTTIDGRNTQLYDGKQYYAPTIEELLASHGAADNAIPLVERSGNNYRTITQEELPKAKQEEKEQQQDQQRQQNKNTIKVKPTQLGDITGQEGEAIPELLTVTPTGSSSTSTNVNRTKARQSEGLTPISDARTKDIIVFSIGHSGYRDSTGAAASTDLGGTGEVEYQILGRLGTHMEKMIADLGLQESMKIVSGKRLNVGESTAGKETSTGKAYTSNTWYEKRGMDFVEIHYDSTNSSGKPGVIYDNVAGAGGYEKAFMDVYGAYPDFDRSKYHLARSDSSIIEIGSGISENVLNLSGGKGKTKEKLAMDTEAAKLILTAARQQGHDVTKLVQVLKDKGYHIPDRYRNLTPPPREPQSEAPDSTETAKVKEQASSSEFNLSALTTDSLIEQTGEHISKAEETIKETQLQAQTALVVPEVKQTTDHSNSQSDNSLPPQHNTQKTSSIEEDDSGNIKVAIDFNGQDLFDSLPDLAHLSSVSEEAFLDHSFS